MAIRPATFMILAVLLAAAAGTGGWLAVRQNRADAGSGDIGVAPGAARAAVPAAVAAAAAPAVSAAERSAGDAPEVRTASAPEPERTAGDAPADDAPAPTVAAAHDRDAAAEPRPAAAAASAGEEPRPAAPPPVAPPAPPAAITAHQDAPGAAETPEAPAAIPAVNAAPPAARAELPRVAGWVRAADKTARAADNPPPVERLVIGAGAVIGLQLETPVSSADAAVEDDVAARVTRDVLAAGRPAIPAGTRVVGSVVQVEQAGKLRGKSLLGVRFHTAVMDDGTEVPLITDAVYREGPGSGNASARRIGGGAVGGAILGAIFGGRRGAAIGSAAGAAGGTALTMSGDVPPATFQAGAALTIRLLNPVTVTADRTHPGGS